MNERVIVSMTSYPKRIGNVGRSIFALLNKQTRCPDEIHLWLAKENFPKMNEDLPPDLQVLIHNERVFLHWLDVDMKVHKRHEIFKIAKDSDCIFLIDDDVYYSNELIETVMKTHEKFPDCIICYNSYSPHVYDGRHIKYLKNLPESEPKANHNRWCGQSMIPAKIYPKTILDDAHQRMRNATSPISDECWFQPWTVYYDIPIFHLKFDWGKDISPNTGKNSGLVAWSHKKDNAGYTFRDNWLYAVLQAYPEILEKYKRKFNYGK